MPKTKDDGYIIDDKEAAKGNNPYKERIKERKKKEREKEELEKKD